VSTEAPQSQLKRQRVTFGSPASAAPSVRPGGGMSFGAYYEQAGARRLLPKKRSRAAAALSPHRPPRLFLESVRRPGGFPTAGRLIRTTHLGGAPRPGRCSWPGSNRLVKAWEGRRAGAFDEAGYDDISCCSIEVG
jgi:hypothetical protein